MFWVTNAFSLVAYCVYLIMEWTSIFRKMMATVKMWPLVNGS